MLTGSASVTERIRSASAWALVRSVRGAMTRNSSPPQRPPSSAPATSAESRPAKAWSTSSPGGVAVGVVDELEPVEVQQQHAERRAMTDRVLVEARQLLLEVPTVVHAGQHVGTAKPVEVRVALAQLVLQVLYVGCGGHPGEQLG